MDLHTKALYRLLRMNHDSDSSIACERWQIEDLRKISLEELWQRLAKMGLTLSAESFRQFAQECDSPEDLAEILSETDDPEQQDAIYLLLFELWRRLLPEKQSLSIFSDEFDERISLYYAGELQSDEPIQDALSNLHEILSEHVDAGVKPLTVFQTISSYFAHDLMAFIIDYISNLLDAQNQRYASELIEDFSSYTPDLIWFDFLRARLVALTDSIKANQMVFELLTFDDKLTIDLLLEILRFQVSYGERSIFAATIKKIVPRLKTEDEFHEMLMLCAEYFRRRDREDLEQTVQQLLKKRQTSSGKDRSFDSDLRLIEQLIHANDNGVG